VIDQERVERAAGRFKVPDGAFQRLVRRRDRRRRNQRITAGFVGMAVFVAVVWMLTSVNPLGRSETSVVPAASSTTGPAETGWDGSGLPPEGTALSTPVKGQPILQQEYGGEELLGRQIVSCPTGCIKWYHTFLIVYADGRALWWNDLRSPGGGEYVNERRLTPEGVDLVRSGVEPEHLPNSAWADAEARPYAPPRYSVCFWANGVDDPSAMPLLPAVDLLAAPAKALLDGSDPDPLHPGCLVVGTKEARTFNDILSEEGLEAASDLGGVTPGATVGSWLLRDAERTLGKQVGIYLRPLWPDGDWHQACCR
jgi:hypothetical protein